MVLLAAGARPAGGQGCRKSCRPGSWASIRDASGAPRPASSASATRRRPSGGRIDEEVLAHSENINFFGAIKVDIDAELAQLGPPVTGH